MPTVTIYTGGACQPNPGRGGWAYLLTRDGVTTEASGAVQWTTNNGMEMQAAIEAISALTEPSDVELATDSEYLAIGITEHLANWKQNRWQTAGGKPVKNRDLWEKLDTLCRKHRVSWRLVRGSAGDPSNKRCDFLAKQEAGILEGAPEPRWKEAKAAKKLEREEARADVQQVRTAMVSKVKGREGEIRADRAAGNSWRQLSEKYGVPKTLIQSIVHNRDLSLWIGEAIF